ncbi:MAG: hypothetical protein KC475_11220, partial [Cyanobacteria bacterium HKST-UBA03]|nr:hypothetical protein [Cyanobacteria bacterium HKST-UBA03]
MDPMQWMNASNVANPGAPGSQGMGMGGFPLPPMSFSNVFPIARPFSYNWGGNNPQYQSQQAGNNTFMSNGSPTELMSFNYMGVEAPSPPPIQPHFMATPPVQQQYFAPPPIQ